jgi:oligopeptidase B
MTVKFADIPAPRTEMQPKADNWHGISRIDEYAWLRAENWQEVFKDPSLLEPAIQSHLEAENTYQAAMMADTA